MLFAITVVRTSDADRAVVPVFCEELHYSLDEEEIRDFEILPLDVMDSFWKCDIGCINIDCVDFHQLATSQQASTSLSRKKNSKNRSKNRAKYVKGSASGFGSSGKTDHQERTTRHLQGITRIKVPSNGGKRSH